MLHCDTATNLVQQVAIVVYRYRQFLIATFNRDGGVHYIN